MADDESPNYARLHVDTWQTINSTLPRAQAAKLLYAMAEYFFEGTEPDEGSLPKAAVGLFNIQKSAIASYRRNALNGSRNQPKTTRKPSNKPSKVSPQKPAQVFEGSNGTSPAETRKVGGGQSPKKSSNIINHESIINSGVGGAVPHAQRSAAVRSTDLKDETASRVVTGTDPRAAAEAGRGRPAAALPTREGPTPTREEYLRVARILEEQGLEALTEQDRETYHAGHAAWAATA